jgi:hypothetical protein
MQQIAGCALAVRSITAAAVACALLLLVESSAAGPSNEDCRDAYLKAQELRRDGHLLAADEALTTCADRACPQQMQPKCAGWRDEVRAELPTLKLEVKDEQGNVLRSAAVMLDDNRLLPRTDGGDSTEAALLGPNGAGVPLDPGEHRLVVTAEGFAPQNLTFTVNRGGRLTLPIVLAIPASSRCARERNRIAQLVSSGRLREAREQLGSCGASCPAGSMIVCTTLSGSIDARQPTLVFDVNEADGDKVTAVRVTIDGQSLRDSLDGAPVPVDPGSHRFVFEAGSRKVEQTIDVGAGERGRHVQVVFPPTRHARPMSPVVIAAGAVGLVGAVTGVVLIVMAEAKYSKAFDECHSRSSTPPFECTNYDAIRDRQTAVDEATAASIAGVAGVALLVGAATLFFVTPGTRERVSITSAIAPGAGAIRLTGAW